MIVGLMPTGIDRSSRRMLGDESAHRLEPNACIPKFDCFVPGTHDQPSDHIASGRHAALNAADVLPRNEPRLIIWWAGADHDARICDQCWFGRHESTEKICSA